MIIDLTFLRDQYLFLYGKSSAGANNTDQYLTADVQLAAYGVSKDASKEQLKLFIMSKGINVTDIKIHRT